MTTLLRCTTIQHQSATGHYFVVCAECYCWFSGLYLDEATARAAAVDHECIYHADLTVKR